MDIRKVTLDELQEEVAIKETQMKEKDVDKMNILMTSCEVANMCAEDKPIKVITDYDADGICSAYITVKTAQAINPDIDIEVICNDRRGAYGVPKYIEAEENTNYIILDMGSAEMSYIYDTFGKDTIVIDHHLMNDETKQLARENSRFLNLHKENDDSLNAQYCTTGLAYRMYEEYKKVLANSLVSDHVSDVDKAISKDKLDRLSDIKLSNTLSAVAMIGTKGDCVNVMDMYSDNRRIIKEGFKVLENANPDNFDYLMGYFLGKTGIDNIVNSKDIETIVAILNSSRMSELLGKNIAQQVIDALLSDENKSSSYLKINDIVAIYEERKALTKGTNLTNVIESERGKDTSICIFEVPFRTDKDGNNAYEPHAFCGLHAGRIAEATDKACICFTYNEETQTYSGSGRNADGNLSLKEYMDNTVGNIEGVIYGGHNDAVGISAIPKDKYAEFCDKLIANQEQLADKDRTITVLDIAYKDIATQDTIDKLKSLEPLGTGLKIPPIYMDVELPMYKSGVNKGEVKTNNIAKANNPPSWKKVELKEANTEIKDWNFQPQNYRLDDNGKCKLLVNMEINRFMGAESVSLTRTHNRDMDFVVKEINKDLMESNEKQEAKSTPKEATRRKTSVNRADV